MKTLVRNIFAFALFMSVVSMTTFSYGQTKDPFTVDECKLVPISAEQAILYFYEDGDRNVEVQVKQDDETLMDKFEINLEDKKVALDFSNLPRGYYFIDVPDPVKVIRIHVRKSHEKIKVVSAWYQKPSSIAMR